MRKRLVEREFTVHLDDNSELVVVASVEGPSDRGDAPEDEGQLTLWWNDDDVIGFSLPLAELQLLLQEAEGVRISLASLEGVDHRTLMRRRRRR